MGIYKDVMGTLVRVLAAVIHATELFDREEIFIDAA